MRPLGTVDAFMDLGLVVMGLRTYRVSGNRIVVVWVSGLIVVMSSC